MKAQGKTPLRKISFCACILCGVLLLAILSLFIGSTAISISDVFRALSGSNDPFAQEALQTIVDFRLPLLVQAFFIGGLLALSGAALQAILQNPLAEPYILGTSSGAAFGLTLASVLGFASSFWLRTLLSFTGGIAAAIVVFLSVWRRRGTLSPLALILSGVVIGAFLQALCMGIQAFLSPFEFRNTLGLLLGAFHILDWHLIALTLLPALAAGGALYSRAISLDLLSTGFTGAHSLGLNIRRELAIIICLVSFITALAVSLAGIIAFVGLVAPHLVRKASGGRHGRLLPAAFIAGGCFTVLADALARLLSPWGQIPVGAFTALIGAPIFIYALRRYGRVHDSL
jgi:iron complex transport system permease protein